MISEINEVKYSKVVPLHARKACGEWSSKFISSQLRHEKKWVGGVMP